MNIAVNQSTTHESTLIWAIICSILLHAALAVVVPNLKFDEAKTPDTLNVELVKKEPPPVAQPEPVQPQPEVTKPEPKPLPKPIVKPRPTPVVEKIDSMPEQPTPIAPPPNVIAAAPKVDAAPPAQTVPAPVPVKQEPPPPPAPSQADIDDARDRYGNALWSAISKHKKYPKIAQMRGWEGEAIVELVLDSSGKIKSKKIAQSSGFEALDKQALEMVDKAVPFPTPPEALRSNSFTITVPVPFKLENS